MYAECFTLTDNALAITVSRRAFQFYFINFEHAICQQGTARVAHMRGEGVTVLRIPRTNPTVVGIFQANVQAVACSFQMVCTGQLLQKWRYIGRDVLVVVLQQYKRCIDRAHNCLVLHDALQCSDHVRFQGGRSFVA